ncbi:MAG: hypothetical protein AABX64_02505 [Nanoarchaeota archaeon]
MLFLSAFAAAAPGISENEVVLNVDYSQFVDEDDDFIVVTTEAFTITNDGPATSVKIEITGLPSGYDWEPKEEAIPENGKSMTLSIEVPHKKDQGTEKIGTIVIKDLNDNQLDSIDLNQDTASMLQLKELEIRYVNYRGDTQKEEFKNQDTATFNLGDEVKPYTPVTMTFYLRNLFDNDFKADGSLDEIEISLDSDDDDLFETPLEDKYLPESSLEAGKNLEFTIPFMISKDVDADIYTLELTITAEDGQGIEYSIEKELVLEIELDDDDVRIVKAEILPAAVTICDAEFNLDVELRNFGTDHQEFAGLSIINAELGINEIIQNIELKPYAKENNYWNQEFTLELKNPKAKTYYLDLNVYINDNQLSQYQRLELPVKSCAEPPVVAEEEEVAEEDTEELDKPAVEAENTSGQPSSAVVETVEKLSYGASDYIMALLVIAIVVVAVMVILMLFLLFRRQ